jgi:hypothetical protein
VIVIHSLKIAFQPIPKVATTSLFNWLCEIVFDRAYEPEQNRRGRRQHIHSWFYRQRTELIESIDPGPGVLPTDYLTFCLTRDPVRRFISAYSNRVLHHGDLDLRGRVGERIDLYGLVARPEINFLVENLTEYMKLAPPIRHHARPMVDYTGRDVDVYDRILEIGDLDAFRHELMMHWADSGIAINGRPIPPMPRKQIGGPKLGFDVLSAESFSRLMDFYGEDYGTFSVLDAAETRASFEQSRVEHAERYSEQHEGRLSIKRRKPKGVILSRLLNRKRLATDATGTIERLRGAVLLEPGVGANYRLVIRDARGEVGVGWGMRSPAIARRFPDNPAAEQARFQTKNVRISRNRPAKLFLVDEAGHRDLLFSLSLKPR